jgi:hypothetical protein
MINSKVLTDSAWKDVLAKNKGVKDNGLLKCLAEVKKLGDDDHGAAQDLLDQIQKLAAQLKKNKDVAAVPAAGKLLAELSSAADAAMRDVAKAKAEADKTAKAKADAEKKAHAEAAKKGEDEEDDEDPSGLLTHKLKPLLRMVAKGDTMHALVAKSGKNVVVMLSRKPIPPARRKMLSEELGGGSTKFYPGHCCLEAGATTFVLKAEVAGMSKLVKAALLEQTGLRLNKVKCRGEDGDDDDNDEEGAAVAEQVEPEASDSTAAAGKTFKTRLAALLPRIKEAAAAGGDGAQQAKDMASEAGALAGKNDFAAANVALDKVEQLLDSSTAAGPGAQAVALLNKARSEWNSARAHAVSELARLKQLLQHEYSDDSAEPAALAKALQRVDATIDAMGDELNHQLDQVANAQSNQRAAQAASAKATLQRLMKLVSSDEILQHVDGNELAPDMVIAAPLRAKLAAVAQSLP